MKEFLLQMKMYGYSILYTKLPTPSISEGNGLWRANALAAMCEGSNIHSMWD